MLVIKRTSHILLTNPYVDPAPTIARDPRNLAQFPNRRGLLYFVFQLYFEHAKSKIQIEDHPFGTYANNTCVYKWVRNVSFSERFAYVQSG